MRRLLNVKVSEMTARQPSVPKWIVIHTLQKRGCREFRYRGKTAQL
jgi:hypothetical protein